jgi:hypothetical protein
LLETRPTNSVKKVVASFRDTELGVEVEMNKGRSHGVILGKWGKESQTKLGRLVFIIDLRVHVLTPRGYRLAECICESAGWGFGWLGLDGVSESAENTDRDFSDMNMKEQVLDRCLYTY